MRSDGRKSSSGSAGFRSHPLVLLRSFQMKPLFDTWKHPSIFSTVPAASVKKVTQELAKPEMGRHSTLAVFSNLKKKRKKKNPPSQSVFDQTWVFSSVQCQQLISKKTLYITLVFDCNSWRGHDQWTDGPRQKGKPPHCCSMCLYKGCTRHIQLSNGRHFNSKRGVQIDRKMDNVEMFGKYCTYKSATHRQKSLQHRRHTKQTEKNLAVQKKLILL